MKKITVKQAVNTLCRALTDDPAYWNAWRDNIAMAFIDMARQGKAPHTRRAVYFIAQAGADSFLQQLTYRTRNKKR